MNNQTKIQQGLMSSDYPFRYCQKRAYRWVLVTDEHVAHYHARTLLETFHTQGISMEFLVIAPGEQSKSREMKAWLEDRLCMLRCGRDTTLIAMGGGVVLDLVGFVAATYLRGIPVIYIPTTLLAMADASLGGKTGINTAMGKNLIGTFTAPQEVWMDLDFLNTLPEREWRTGVVEMIKHALIADAQLFHDLSQTPVLFQANDQWSDLLYRSILIKSEIVAADETEQGCRSLLNFGHTIGHAVEHLEAYQLTHGEAVAIGIVVESYLSMRQGGLSRSHFDRIYQLLQHFQLPLKTRVFQNPDRLFEVLAQDKKAYAGTVRCVLLKEIGVPYQEKERFTCALSRVLWEEAFAWANAQLG